MAALRQLARELDAEPGRRAGDERDFLQARHRRLDDLARLARRLADRQRVDIFHAALDLAPDGVLAVEEAGESPKQMKNWLLALSGLLRAGHRSGAAHVRLAARIPP